MYDEIMLIFTANANELVERKLDLQITKDPEIRMYISYMVKITEYLFYKRVTFNGFKRNEFMCQIPRQKQI